MFCWSDRLSVKQIIATTFCIEVEFEIPGLHRTCWGIFVYFSPDKQLRLAQMAHLLQQQNRWGDYWFLGGDLNDIKDNSEKKGGRLRSEASFTNFRDFIRALGAAEIQYKGPNWTWANNRENEGFVEERLDRFLASPDWILQYHQATVTHVYMQSSDHTLLILEDKPHFHSPPRRFYFDKRFLDLPEAESVIDSAWNTSCQGTPMFQTCERIKLSRIGLLKLKGAHHLNSSRTIRDIKGKMEDMQKEGGNRNWSLLFGISSRIV